MRGLVAGALFGLVALGRAATTGAEPHFLAKQYARCGTCHYSASGGGLLTEYGRMLSRQELSTTGKSPAGVEPEPGEERFLWGALGEGLGPLRLGADLRPAHLDISGPGFSSERSFWMRADLQAAVQQGPWTFYGEIGRAPEGDGGKLNSYEYWGRYEWESGTSVRAGRFLPAFGLKVADHTSYIRRNLGFDRNGQMFGLELADAGERHLFQFDIGPGFAESVLADDGSASFLASARAQFDLTNRQTLVLSGMYRGSTETLADQWLGSVAYGIAPTPRLAIWGQLAERVSEGWDGTPEYTLFAQVSYEVVRGLWLQFAPQMQTELNNVSGGAYRWSLGADWLARTHFNLVSTWTRDVIRQQQGLRFDTWMIQLHLYL